MKTRASPTLIGVFTLVGLAITSAAIVLLGADKFFRSTHSIQLYFDKSAQGLQVGSDVRFGGVRVGSVQSIDVMIDPDEYRKIIPVIVSLNARDLGAVGIEAEGGIDFSSHQGVQKAVQRGLRAGMKQQSLVTGQLYIEFDVQPEAIGFVYQPREEPEFPVVPTIGTEIDELIAGIADGIRKFNALDLDSIISELRELLHNTSTRIEAIDAEGISRNLLTITEDISSITGDDRIASAIENLNETLENLESITRKADDGISPLIDEAGRVLASGRDVIEESQKSLAKLDTAIDGVSDISNPRGPVLMRLQQALHEIERTSHSIKELSNDLKRDPKSILSGKAEAE